MAEGSVTLPLNEYKDILKGERFINEIRTMQAEGNFVYIPLRELSCLIPRYYIRTKDETVIELKKRENILQEEIARLKDRKGPSRIRYFFTGKWPTEGRAGAD